MSAEPHDQLGQLLRASRQGICVVDTEGRCTELNPAMAALLGRTVDDVRGRPLMDAVDAAARDALLAAMQGDRARTGIDLAWVAPDGRPRRCLADVTPLRGAQGQAAGWLLVCGDPPERVASAPALRVHEAVLNAASEMVSVLDAHETYHLVNDAWCRAFGLRREQVLGRHREDFMPGVVSPARIQALQTCLSERRSVAVRDTVQLSPQAPPRVLHTDFHPIALGDPGQPLAALVTRDVTAEDAQREALATTTEYLRATLEASGEAIYATDSEHDDEPARFANAHQFALWKMPLSLQGRLTNAIVMAHMRRLLPDPEAVFARMEAIVQAREPVDGLHLTLLDGRHVRVGFACVRLGRRTLRVWSARDVTAEVAAVAAREAVLAEQRAVLDSFPGYIAVFGAEDRYVHVNDRLAALIRRPAAEIVGRPAEQVLGEARWRRLRQTLEQARRLGMATSHAQYPALDGQGLIDLEVTHVAGSRQGEAPPPVFAFGIDVTERRRTQAALVDALAAAERANQAKSQFLSSMSHELRTPLNAVLGFGQLLAQQPLTPEHRHQVTEILRGGRHLLGLINDLLDLGRIEAGALEVVCEPVDAAAAIDEALGLMEPLARGHGVTLRHRRGAGPAPRVQADPQRLRQVLLNLLSNAIKYNQPGGQVFVDATPRGRQVELGVHDTGPGLTADEQQRLFQPFERLQARQGPVDGTGIGLALSRSLVEAMDGRIGIVSEPGQGSTFWVRLPGARQVQAPAAAPAPDLPPAPARRLRALYIEDNAVNLMLMAAMLEDELDLATEDDPLRGLARAQAQPPDLVLLDIQLPGIDGHEVLRRLRADARTARIPVVAVSANAMRADVDAGLAAGFDAYLTKPVDLAQLRATVRRLAQPPGG